MTGRRRPDWELPAIIEWQDKVADAARPFEARWTDGALHRIDPALHGRLHRQQQLFSKALANGGIDEIATQGAAMVRGYIAVFEAMQAAGIADDAYQIGRDPNSGMTIAVGPKPACERVRERHGDDVRWFSPDEVAAMVAMEPRFRKIAEVKRRFPGAEITNVRTTEAAVEQDCEREEIGGLCSPSHIPAPC